MLAIAHLGALLSQFIPLNKPAFINFLRAFPLVVAAGMLPSVIRASTSYNKTYCHSDSMEWNMEDLLTDLSEHKEKMRPRLQVSG